MEQLSLIAANIVSDPNLKERDFEKRRMYGGASRRTYQPVRRHSILKGREGIFWRGTDRKTVRTIVLAAKRYELQTKTKGQRNGALGHVAIEILDYLANLVNYRTGQLDPSIETLKEKLCRSRDAIVRALKALRRHGFLDWIRRYVPTDNDGQGPQVQQTSNAYRLLMPARAQKALGRYGVKTPIPADVEHALETQAAEYQDMLNSLQWDDKIRAEVDDPKMAEALVRLKKSMMNKRESAEQTESLSPSFLNRKMDRLKPDID